MNEWIEELNGYLVNSCREQFTDDKLIGLANAYKKGSRLLSFYRDNLRSGELHLGVLCRCAQLFIILGDSGPLPNGTYYNSDEFLREVSSQISDLERQLNAILIDLERSSSSREYETTFTDKKAKSLILLKKMEAVFQQMCVCRLSVDEQPKFIDDLELKLKELKVIDDTKKERPKATKFTPISTLHMEDKLKSEILFLCERITAIPFDKKKRSTNE